MGMNETGLEIDERKEKSRSTVVMMAFKFLMMNMGLPWRDVTLENLEERLEILDKLTKKDFRSFMVAYRPDLYELEEEGMSKQYTSKLAMRLARKN
jgi:hypothetical protein